MGNPFVHFHDSWKEGKTSNIQLIEQVQPSLGLSPRKSSFRHHRSETQRNDTIAQRKYRQTMGFQPWFQRGANGFRPSTVCVYFTFTPLRFDWPQALSWLAEFKDPKIVSHPVVASRPNRALPYGCFATAIAADGLRG